MKSERKNKKIIDRIHQYTAIFELNEHKGYTVTVPSLPGLVTEGKNFEDAKKMAKDAIRCYLEGLIKEKEEIPRESEIAQVKLEVSL